MQAITSKNTHREAKTNIGGLECNQVAEHKAYGRKVLETHKYPRR